MYQTSGAKTKPIKMPLNNAKVLNFLQLRRSGVLGTTTFNYQPHLVVLYYSVDTDFNIRFLTKTQTQTSRNIKHHKQAVFLVYDERLQTSVKVEGEIETVTDESELHIMFRDTFESSLRQSGESVPPIAKVAAGNYIGFCLRPNRILMSRYHAKQGIKHRIEFNR